MAKKKNHRQQRQFEALLRALVSPVVMTGFSAFALYWCLPPWAQGAQPKDTQKPVSCHTQTVTSPRMPAKGFLPSSHKGGNHTSSKSFVQQNKGVKAMLNQTIHPDKTGADSSNQPRENVIRIKMPHRKLKAIPEAVPNQGMHPHPTSANGSSELREDTMTIERRRKLKEESDRNRANLKQFIELLYDGLLRRTEDPNQQSNIQTWEVKQSPHVSNISSWMDTHNQNTQPNNPNNHPSSSTQSGLIDPSKHASGSDPAFVLQASGTNSSTAPTSLSTPIRGETNRSGTSIRSNRFAPQIPSGQSSAFSAPSTNPLRRTGGGGDNLTPSFDATNREVDHLRRHFTHWLRRHNMSSIQARHRAVSDITSKESWWDNMTEQHRNEAWAQLRNEMNRQDLLKSPLTDTDRVVAENTINTKQAVWAGQQSSIRIVQNPPRTGAWDWPPLVNLSQLRHIVLDNDAGTEIHLVRAKEKAHDSTDSTDSTNSTDSTSTPTHTFVPVRVVVPYKEAAPLRQTLNNIFKGFPVKVKLAANQDADHLRMKNKTALTIHGEPREIEPAVMTSREFNSSRTSAEASPDVPISPQPQQLLVDLSVPAYYAYDLANALNYTLSSTGQKHLMRMIHPDIGLDYMMFSTSESFIQAAMTALSRDQHMLAEIKCPPNAGVATVLCYELRLRHDQESDSIKAMVQSILTSDSISTRDKALMLNMLVETSIESLRPTVNFYEATMRRAQQSFQIDEIGGRRGVQGDCDFFTATLLAQLDAIFIGRIGAIKTLIAECRAHQTRFGRVGSAGHIPEFAEVRLQNGTIDSLINRWQLAVIDLTVDQVYIQDPINFEEFARLPPVRLPDIPFNETEMRLMDLGHKITATPNNRGFIVTNRSVERLLTKMYKQISKVNTQLDTGASVDSIAANPDLNERLWETALHLDQIMAELKLAIDPHIKHTQSKDSSS